jgi:hypothetical protein
MRSLVIPRTCHSRIRGNPEPCSKALDARVRRHDREGDVRADPVPRSPASFAECSLQRGEVVAHVDGVRMVRPEALLKNRESAAHQGRQDPRRGRRTGRPARRREDCGLRARSRVGFVEGVQNRRAENTRDKIVGAGKRFRGVEIDRPEPIEMIGLRSARSVRWREGGGCVSGRSPARI